MPHMTQPTIGNTASLHFCATIPLSSRPHEYTGPRADLDPDLHRPVGVSRPGAMSIPERPGLGLTLDERALERPRGLSRDPPIRDRRDANPHPAGLWETPARITGRATGSAPIPRAAASSRTTGSSRAREAWLAALERAVAACATPPVLAAHSLACSLISPTGRRSRGRARRARSSWRPPTSTLRSTLPDEVRSFRPDPDRPAAVFQHRRGEHRRPVLHDGARGRLRGGVGEPPGDPRPRRPYQCGCGLWPLARGTPTPSTSSSPGEPNFRQVGQWMVTSPRRTA